VGIDQINKAVFFDRDGVINKLVFNEKTNEYEPPHSPGKFIFEKDAIEILKKLYKNNFKLFIISNQPDYAKGKTTLENLKLVHSYFEMELLKNGIVFSSFYYCYHHPQGVVKDFSYKCDCRKPGTLFIKHAIKDFNINPQSSWFIGDRDSDIICGKNSGLKTILIKINESINYIGKIHPDFNVICLKEACDIIIG